jgi:predicted GH43/DUF377 family glycosyl hydrolase
MLPAEKNGSVPDVVFGTGLVHFNGRWLLYYGMADSRIGAAATTDFLPVNTNQPPTQTNMKDNN